MIELKDLKQYIGFGIAGNFAMHLDQAGEALVKGLEDEDQKVRRRHESVRFGQP